MSKCSLLFFVVGPTEPNLRQYGHETCWRWVLFPAIAEEERNSGSHVNVWFCFITAGVIFYPGCSKALLSFLLFFRLKFLWGVLFFKKLRDNLGNECLLHELFGFIKGSSINQVKQGVWRLLNP